MALLRLEDLKRLDVVDRDGKSLGTVVDVVLDLETNRIHSILVEATIDGGRHRSMLSLPAELVHISRERVQVDQTRDNLLLSAWLGKDLPQGREAPPSTH